MIETTITKSAFFAASRDTLWAFLTEADKLALWFHPAQNDLVEGEQYSLIQVADDGTVTKQCWGEVLKMEKPSHLIYTFTIKPLGGAMTTVKWELEECHGGTKLSLTHEGISQAAGEAAMGLLTALDAGWDKHIGTLRDAVKQS
jgi:uncharacterized protein YndB with AHSA1/START domain